MELFNAATGRCVRFGAGAALALTVGAAWYFAAREGWSLETLRALLEARPVLAPALFLLLHCVAAAALLPCSPFTLAAGFIWGTALGLAVSVASALAASCITFLLARHVAGTRWRESVADSIAGRALDAVARCGWKGVALAQLNPIVPASSLGYVFGLTPLSFRTYAVTALIAMLPLQVALVALGDSVQRALTGQRIVFGILALAALGGAAHLAARLGAKRKNP